jgi:hypothetical protein
MAAGAALTKSRIVSAFKFPPSLSNKHEEELRKRAISKEGIYYVDARVLPYGAIDFYSFATREVKRLMRFEKEPDTWGWCTRGVTRWPLDSLLPD